MKQRQPLDYLYSSTGLFALISILVLVLTRLTLLQMFTGDYHFSIEELLELLFMGLRFDLKIIAVVLVIFFCLPAIVCVLLNRWQLFMHVLRWILLIMLSLIITLSFLEFGFYFYFGNAIDMLVYGLFEDGFYEVMVSILTDWRLLVIILACTLYLIFSSWIFLRNTRPGGVAERSEKTRLRNAAPLLSLTLLLMLLARGSLDTFPLARISAHISDNQRVNSLVLNGPFHLFYTWQDRKKDNLAHLDSQKILEQSGQSDLQQLIEAAGYNASHPLIRPLPDKPDGFHSPHIIFVLMESWSTHIALMDDKDNNVMGEFSKHAQNDYFFPYFFSNAYSTNPTIDSLLLNSPITPLPQSIAAKHSFSLSNIWLFKQHDYDTVFLSGSTSSWRNHDNFWPYQGFDRLIGRASIEKYFAVHSDNPWGVYEEYLFEYMKKLLLEADKKGKPLFSFLLTTNNHPPIRLPENHRVPDFDLTRFGFSSNDEKKRQILSAYHYETDSLGKFISWLRQSELRDRVILVATGDHIYKGFNNYSANDMAYLRYSVPAYFYVPEQYDQLKTVDLNISGSHEDLFPTLYELALSGGQYLSFGTPLNLKHRDTACGWNTQGAFLFDQGVLINGRQLFPWKDEQRIFLSSQAQPASSEQLQKVTQHKYQTLLKKYLLLRDLENSDADIGDDPVDFKKPAMIYSEIP